MRTIFTLSLLATVLLSCKQKAKVEPLVETKEVVSEVEVVKEITPFTRKIEDAHKKDFFMNKKAIQYDIAIAFGGKSRMEATITQLTDGTKIRIDNKSGKKIVFDGKEVFAISEDSLSGGERFDIFTWSYFFAMPYKLNDEGTNWGKESKAKWGESLYDVSKLSFDKGIGDSSKDWYQVYKNPETDVMEGAAYIVSFGKDLEKAESDPHSIRFSDFVTVEGVPFASTWSFHNWNMEQGYTDALGVAKLSNLKFVSLSKGLFDKSENAILVPKP